MGELARPKQISGDTMESAEVIPKLAYGYPDSVAVVGKQSISGSVRVSGSKIAAIPIITATILSEKPVTIVNVPDLEDIRVLLDLLRIMGGEVHLEGHTVTICNAYLQPMVLPAEMVTSVHGTIYLLPALLARFGTVEITRTQGGCAIGERPIAHIVTVLRQMGAYIEIQGENIKAVAPTLHGASMSVQFSQKWDKYRSGATKTFLLAGVRAEGVSIVENAYHRASITQLAAFLRCMGADIVGEGTSRLVIRGGELHGGHFVLAGDYLEALTYLALVASCGGEITVEGFNPDHCRQELMLLEAIGLELEEQGSTVKARQFGRLKATSFTTTEISTDIQPVLAVALTLAAGRSTVVERVWENRFGYAPELKRMGASLRVSENRLFIKGVEALHGAIVHATDLRAAAALLVAAAASTGPSTISGLTHLKRGYYRMLENLSELGVSIAIPDIISEKEQ